jgi:hypothetical protein
MTTEKIGTGVGSDEVGSDHVARDASLVGEP